MSTETWPKREQRRAVPTAEEIDRVLVNVQTAALCLPIPSSRRPSEHRKDEHQHTLAVAQLVGLLTRIRDGMHTEERHKEYPPGTCELCGESLPEGETMFRYHGYSGPCPQEAP